MGFLLGIFFIDLEKGRNFILGFRLGFQDQEFYRYPDLTLRALAQVKKISFFLLYLVCFENKNSPLKELCYNIIQIFHNACACLCV